MKNNRGIHYILSILIVIISVFLDQWTKLLAVSNLKGQIALPIIPEVFELHYLENRGAAFGMMQNQQIFFLICVIIITGFAIWFYCKVPMTKKYLPLRLCAVFIIAGAYGNCIDRVINHYVIDFFYFKLINFPIFNMADIYVTCATAVLAFLLIFYYKEEDLEGIFHRTNN